MRPRRRSTALADDPPRVSAREALARLAAGNARFVANVRSADGHYADPPRRPILPDEQHPMAVIMGCSDARVPAEIVFDQGLGDLFVIRVAGHVVAPSQVGSVEFAASALGVRLVVVLGHTRCGAVQTTLAELGQGLENRSPNLHAIVDRIRPAVEPLLATADADPDAMLGRAVRANIGMATSQLRHGSALLESMCASDGLLIVGAEYSLETGVVEFIDLPDPALREVLAG